MRWQRQSARIVEDKATVALNTQRPKPGCRACGKVAGGDRAPVPGAAGACQPVTLDTRLQGGLNGMATAAPVRAWGQA